MVAQGQELVSLEFSFLVLHLLMLLLLFKLHLVQLSLELALVGVLSQGLSPLLPGASSPLVLDLVGVDAAGEPDPAAVHADCVPGLDEGIDHAGGPGVVLQLLLGGVELGPERLHLFGLGDGPLHSVMLGELVRGDLLLGESALGAWLEEVGALAVALCSRRKEVG